MSVPSIISLNIRRFAAADLDAAKDHRATDLFPPDLLDDMVAPAFAGGDEISFVAGTKASLDSRTRRPSD